MVWFFDRKGPWNQSTQPKTKSRQFSQQRDAVLSQFSHLIPSTNTEQSSQQDLWRRDFGLEAMCRGSRCGGNGGGDGAVAADGGRRHDDYRRLDRGVS
jgi:hypothetical protein